MKRFMRVFLAVVLAVTTMSIASPAEARPYCGLRWGSLEKSADGAASGVVTAARTGRHTCYDRLVLDISGPVEGYSVRYSEGAIIAPRVQRPGSVSYDVDGGAVLQIEVPLGGGDLVSSDLPLGNNWVMADVSRYRTFREVLLYSTTGDQLIVGLGVRARLPFRVFTLAGPDGASRLVIDVAHRW